MEERLVDIGTLQIPEATIDRWMNKPGLNYEQIKRGAIIGLVRLHAKAEDWKHLDPETRASKKRLFGLFVELEYEAVREDWEMRTEQLAPRPVIDNTQRVYPSLEDQEEIARQDFLKRLGNPDPDW